MLGKTVYIIAICLVFALASTSGWLYLRMNDVESKIGDLEKTNQRLTDELSELSKNSTTYLEIIGPPTWITPIQHMPYYCQEVRLVVRNNGTFTLAIIGTLVNGTFFEITPAPAILNPNAETTVNITVPDFISGAKYEIEVRALIIASTGEHTYEATFPPPELRVTDIAFILPNYINVTLENISTLPVTVDEIWMNGQKEWTTGDIIPSNEYKAIQVLYEWVPGNTYQVEVVTSTGGHYLRTETAPA